MANQPALIDSNQNPSLTAASGTNDLTSETRVLTAESVAGSNALHVYTLNSSSSGTNINVFTGTINRVHDLGTVGSVLNVGQIHNAGTIQALPQISVGTIPQVSVGTLPTATVVGPVASGGTATTFPVLIAGTNANGETYSPIVTSSGVMLTTGSMRMTVGTLTTGSLTDLANLYNGTVRMSVGTMTTGSLTDLAKLYSGTINVGTFVHPSGTVTTIVAGTQNTLGTVGTILGIGTLTNVGIVNSGTVTTRGTGFEGGTVAVGTAAVELTFTGVTRGIMVTADHLNGTMVYIGPSTVSQAGSSAITSLFPGESLSLELNDASAPIYAVGGTTGQKIYKAAIV